jgi:hypothetical protein
MPPARASGQGEDRPTVAIRKIALLREQAFFAMGHGRAAARGARGRRTAAEREHGEARLHPRLGRPLCAAIGGGAARMPPRVRRWQAAPLPDRGGGAARGGPAP